MPDDRLPPPAGQPAPPAAPPAAPAPASGDDRWTWQFWVTIGLLVGFGVLLVVLMINAEDATEVEWNRRVYLFTAVEAIVFTSVGWLFGREVNRGAVETAKSTADKATTEAAAARTEATAMAAEVAVERTKGKAVRTFVRHLPSQGGAPAGGAQEVGLRGVGERDVAVDPLRAVVEELWPD